MEQVGAQCDPATLSNFGKAALSRDVHDPFPWCGDGDVISCPVLSTRVVHLQSCRVWSTFGACGHKGAFVDSPLLPPVYKNAVHLLVYELERESR